MNSPKRLVKLVIIHCEGRYVGYSVGYSVGYRAAYLVRWFLAVQLICCTRRASNNSGLLLMARDQGLNEHGIGAN